jgi:anhydro-N-acetylmuramic acid kinase
MRIIGLMSGTSVDGIDAALVEIEDHQTSLTIHLLQAQTYPYSESLRSQILAVCSGDPLTMESFATLDDAIAQEFAKAALAINHGHPKAQLIGSHGQTVFHRPRNPQATETLGYSLQLGRGALIAHLTQIETISNFRAADIAAQGQGAPLVPPIDAALLTHPTHSRAIQNIGGIGNVTYLPARNAIQAPILGWDTGPGNMLLDLAITQFTNGKQTYDADGAWAATGAICDELVTHWLTQPFFRQAPPKSTGREQFSAAYLESCRQAAKPFSLMPADFLATLTELTARSIAQSYQQFLPALPDEVLLCGGGSRNGYLKSRIQANLPSVQVLTTDEAGINADAKEAIAFAVLAYWRHCGQFGNLPAVTGATQFVLLGEIHPIPSNLPVLA